MNLTLPWRRGLDGKHLVIIWSPAHGGLSESLGLSHSRSTLGRAACHPAFIFAPNCLQNRDILSIDLSDSRFHGGFGDDRIVRGPPPCSDLCDRAIPCTGTAGYAWYSVWLALREPHFANLGSGPVALGLGVVLVLHVAGHWTLRGRSSRRRDENGAKPRRLVFIAATLCLFAFPTARGLDRRWRPDLQHDGPAPNILLIVLDTVRADRLSSFGYDRPTSPELDAFAERAIRFNNFYSTSVWTIPSHASLFTGLFPVRHQATQERRWLPSEFVTLAEVLQNTGYTTWAASGNPNVSERINLARGFERFIETWRRESNEEIEDAAEVPSGHSNNVAFAQFLATSERDRPFFAFINYVDAHVPLAPPSPYLERFLRIPERLDRALRLGRLRSHEHFIGAPYGAEDLELLSDLYDAEIAYLSHVVEELLEMLQEDGRYEDTLIVITSDHGEHFGEQELLGHMFGLYNTTVRIPLMIRLPHGARAGDVDTRKGQLVDLFPTLLNAAGVAPSTMETHGSDLLAQDSPRREVILSEYYYPLQELQIFSPVEFEAARERLRPFLRRVRAIQRYGYRFIQGSDGRNELYNILRDPGETQNLLDEEGASSMSEKMQFELDVAFGGLLGGEPDPFATAPIPRQGSAQDLDDDTRDALRSLGYVR